MGNRNPGKRYKQSERIFSGGLIVDTVLFLLYLLAAGNGITWLKVTFTVLSFLVSGAALAILYLTGEMRKKRSLYLVVGFAAVVVCILFSLILNYPSPAYI